ncbi:hypothetical protein [Actinocatenispora comari]|jgi:hypothetical protein|uniref:Uncharacterized protein n=1 Tax=Actinocatenispora comari TaxID=2807577 RepID=A0A8J4EM38_9ACTN|nr:hypothetical protein [Actinocatenispora comari]GIL29151.1 hypothetical protein NUM_44050 [Actinocatenispora comari]
MILIPGDRIILGHKPAVTITVHEAYYHVDQVQVITTDGHAIWLPADRLELAPTPVLAVR